MLPPLPHGSGDAAKAGAALSREPLSQFKAQLAERVKAVEDLQHRTQVQREVALLLAQRIEVLSTSPGKTPKSVLEALGADVARWQDQAKELTGDASWTNVDSRFPPQLEAASAQLAHWFGMLFSLHWLKPKRLPLTKLLLCLPSPSGPMKSAWPAACHPWRPLLKLPSPQRLVLRLVAVASLLLSRSKLQSRSEPGSASAEG